MAFQEQLRKIKALFAVNLIFFLGQENASVGEVHNEGLGQLLSLSRQQSALKNNIIAVTSFRFAGGMGI